MLNLHLSAAPWMTMKMMMMKTTLPSSPHLAPFSSIAIVIILFAATTTNIHCNTATTAATTTTMAFYALVSTHCLSTSQLDAFGKILVKFKHVFFTAS